MINSAQEFVDLLERGDAASKQRLRSDVAPVRVWEEIISLHPDLKRTVALNKTLDKCVIRLLAKDADLLVRADIANRRGLPLDLFAQLARDPEESVRARIAWNKKTPTEVLHLLLNDSSEIVVEAAKNRLGTT